MKAMGFETFIVDSICASVSVTGVISVERMNVLIGLEGGRTLNEVIGATLLRCGDGELFKAA